METFFAPAGRTGEKELARQLDLVAGSGLVSAFLHSVGMVLAVVNRQRQVVALNDAFLRMFQRNFSNKDGSGRGFGTYSMKLFGEEILKGKVDFTTSPEEGTVFSFTCPLAGPPSV